MQPSTSLRGVSGVILEFGVAHFLQLLRPELPLASVFLNNTCIAEEEGSEVNLGDYQILPPLFQRHRFKRSDG